MDEFCVRLLSFFDRGMEGKPGRWPHPTPSPEAMAAAGFRLLQDGQSPSGDSVTCDFCKMQAWAWERKDDPFLMHKEALSCEYVDSGIFRDHHENFLQKQDQINGTGESRLTPPSTPTKKTSKPRRRMRLSPIVTVYDSMPSQEANHKSVEKQKDGLEPIKITVSTGETEIVIQLTDTSERGEPPFPMPIEIFHDTYKLGRHQENPPWLSSSVSRTYRQAS
ncbi:hypothetical protein CORC01_00686 [Colletotrichum orchidophilum]|uniref:Uncharacterized protein n=1 Tax=Colletotrichum orchidophilum TaxID=1209926 RepID=A0A1G4BQU9_9PEZI|nr:uncharacterized protein CORC01_00686 [Colletotrichum orchidophilum]OHF03824.1 hypothetical protein CORC01_00686 [Colletotrichum orchidophilum]